MRGVSFDVPRGRDLRLPRPQRRRQDDDAADADDAAADRRRHRDGGGLRRRARSPASVRARIGYVSQLGGADDLATGRENLHAAGAAVRRRAAQRSRRASKSCSRCSISRASPTAASKTYSGGQRRRLDVALGHRARARRCCSSTSRRTGLDPQNRANLWDHLRGCASAGTTVFLTTHYLEEADALCDRVMIIDHGQIVAEGSPRELKREVVGDSVVLRVREDGDAAERAPRAAGAARVRPRASRAPTDGQLRCYVDDGAAALPELLRLLDGEHDRPALDQPVRADARRRLPAQDRTLAARRRRRRSRGGGAMKLAPRHGSAVAGATRCPVPAQPGLAVRRVLDAAALPGAVHAAAQAPRRASAARTCSTSSCPGSSRCSRSRAASSMGFGTIFELQAGRRSSASA